MAEPPGPRLLSPEDVRGLRAARRTLDQLVPSRHSAEQIWPYFSQVDLFNRAAGSSAVDYDVVPKAESASVIRGTSRKLGLAMRYQELPYEWQAPRFVQAELFYETGPFRYLRIRGDYFEEQSTVRYMVDYVARRRFGIAGLMARGILKKLVTIFRGIDTRLPASFVDPLGAKGFEDRSPAALRRAEDLAKHWRPLAPDAVVAEACAEFIATAPDRLVGRMRPYALAEQLGTNRTETLRFCLNAARAGFLDLRWDLICPSCGGAKGGAAKLADLGTGAHCEVCNIRYDADLARNVELSFRPRPDIRMLDDGEYCLQSPSHQRQILAQINLEPAATCRLDLSLRPGHYRLRCIGRDGEALFDSAYGRERKTVTVRIGTQVGSEQASCGSVLDLLIVNESSHWRTVRFERHGYRDDAAPAAEILELPEFREWFGDDGSGFREGLERRGVADLHRPVERLPLE